MILMLMSIGPAWATTMCAANDTVAVVLDPSVGMTNYNKDVGLGTWWVWGPYGTVHGISACLNVGESMGNTVARLTDTNNGETNLVVGSEKYGRYCWCRMTHPAVSLWTFNYMFSSASVCASRCMDYCGDNVRSNSSLRAGLFGSVAN